MNFQLAALLTHWLTYFKCIRVHAQIYSRGFHWSIQQFQRYCISVHRKNKTSLLHEDGHIRQTDVTLFFFYLKENCLHRWGKKLH